MKKVHSHPEASNSPFNPPQFLFSLLLFILLSTSIIFVLQVMRAQNVSKALLAICSLIIGVGGIWALFYLLNRVVSALGSRVHRGILPYIFVLPAVGFLTLYLFYPIVRTIIISLYDRTATNFIGLANYVELFTDPEMLIVLRNTLMWIVMVPAFSVSLGLLVAVMSDHLQPRWEKMVKSLIFLPMAISFVGASVIWRFVYYYLPGELPQVGLLNAIVQQFGGEPQAWLTRLPWRETPFPWANNIFLIMIMVWLQTGFAMVVLSSAVKSVPKQLLEAARVDGANEVRIFFGVIIPYISNTILTVTTTILILVLKIFDIVFVMTSGQHNTDVIASRMYSEAFRFRDFGKGSALAVLLFVAVIPFIISNVRSLKGRLT